ncbi:guanine nucleotide-binding protein-like 3 homolog [Watersipora subatra]|uniref:guanine nucleotide-binding protein-like 3 homolog n=1 Tax=Watersipora subatra TaxID=2589382 RepID=UPI00355C8A57
MAVRGFKKKASKRQTTRHRAKIERKVKEHNRKQRKEAKKIPNNRKLKRKDPGVPNTLPFKDEILLEAKRRRDQREQLKEESKLRKKEARAKKREAIRSGALTLSDLVKEAASKTEQFEMNEEFVSAEREKLGSGKAVEGSLKAYYKEFRKVIEAADVVLEILDARDPIGSRCPQVEQAVVSAGANKRLVLVLNKIDLVPKDNVTAWLKYLRNELPTIAFKSSTQTQSDHLSRSNIAISKASEGLIKTSTCLGADVLLKLLANYSRSKDLKTAIRVGVVGFPNTGKSSIINSLKRSKACMVGNTPGVTKAMQEVQLDKNVRLLDCPGIVMASGDEVSAHTILRNAVKVEQVVDPVVPVELILQRSRKDQMMMQYNIPMYTDCANFLALLTKRYGMLKKGGLPNITKAARMVLQDWNSGKITYYTQPPEQHTLPTHLSAELVTSMAAEFDIDALTNAERDDMKGLKSHMSNAMLVTSNGFTEEVSEQVDEDVELDSDNESETMAIDSYEPTPSTAHKQSLSDIIMPDPTPKRKTRLSVALASRSPVTPEDMQLNKMKKKEYKKMKKQRKRADKLSDELTSALEAGLGGLGDDLNL